MGPHFACFLTLCKIQGKKFLFSALDLRYKTLITKNVNSAKQNLFLPIFIANTYVYMSGTSKRDSPDTNCVGKWNKTHLGPHNNGFS